MSSHPLLARSALILAAALWIAPLPTEAAKPARSTKQGPSYAGRAEVGAFAAEIAKRHGLPRRWIEAQLRQARRIEAVRKLIMPPPPGVAKNWAAYRERFIEPRRIQAGADFWQANADWLAQAEARFGVPAEIVVGIVGVETFYGRISGGFRIVDALATLAFDFPPGRSDRSAFFRSELEEFFVFCAREGVDPQAVKGSYAGAIGLAQFMPSSINRDALDFDGNGHIDLRGSAADAVGSVAQFLQRAGWQRGLPARFDATPPAAEPDRAALLAPDVLPSFTAEQMAQRGAELSVSGRAHTGPLALVELHNGEQPPSFVAGTQNFYALTRYNASSYYAMAVLDLGAAVAQVRAAAPAPQAGTPTAEPAPPGQ